MAACASRSCRRRRRRRVFYRYPCRARRLRAFGVGWLRSLRRRLAAVLSSLRRIRSYSLLVNRNIRLVVFIFGIGRGMTSRQVEIAGTLDSGEPVFSLDSAVRSAILMNRNLLFQAAALHA